MAMNQKYLVRLKRFLNYLHPWLICIVISTITFISLPLIIRIIILGISNTLLLLCLMLRCNIFLSLGSGISPKVRLSPKLRTSLLIFVPILLEPSNVDLAEGTNSPILLSILAAHKGIPYLPACEIAPHICLDPAHF